MTTYLLVHGAWHGGRAWERVVPLLEDAGHRVFAPSLTGLGDRAHLASPDVGLDTHVDDIADEIVRNDLSGVVLVGHSYGGMVISGAAHRVPDRIGRLVFLDAMVPVDGETVIDVMPETRKAVEQAVDGWRVPPLPELPPPLGLFGVTDPADVAWLRGLLSDQPVRCLDRPVRMDDPAADAIPRTHIHCVGPRPAKIVRRPLPEVEPDGTPPQVWTLDTGHDCMVTEPAALADLLLKLA
ncbi:alpha/beta fold hydrolase [Actinomadura gamaensis]|uniref:Alpha/beta fold hydrolase n=1 Tax=Actinomadura gamaensis TaxID=1763541 RepID=A0ABV9U8F6_9ACTN